MARDRSFVEYVDARWAALHRLATLLVGEERADEVAREALVRAYLAWPAQVEEHPPDEVVRAILGRVALERPGAAGGPGDATSPLETLPRRQRVVAVLRWFEYLSSTEVARVLGSRPRIVEAESRQALASLGLSEGEVAAVLVRAADAVVVAPPPGEALLSRCHETRRRRSRRTLRLVALATAVVVATLGVATALQQDPPHHERRPTAVPIPRALADLPGGDGPRAPYAELSVLHVAGRTVQLEADPLAIVPAGRWIYVSYSNGTIVRVDRQGLGVSLVTTEAVGPPVVDPAGRYVAWVDASPGRPRVVVEPVDAGAGRSRRVRRFPATGEPVVLVGITPDGDVVGLLPAEGLTWVLPSSARSAGGDPSAPAPDPFQEIQGLGNGAAYQVTRSELVVQYPPNHVAVGRLADGAFVATEDLVATTADAADPRGRRIVYADGAGEIHVRRRAPGFGRDQSQDLRLQLPRLRGGTSGIAWEDDDHVLLEVADASMPLGALVRCDVRSGSCWIAVRFADAPHRLAH